MGDNLIEPSRVTIAGCYVTLGRCFVAVSTPWGYECGEVGIILVEGNAVVANLAVKYGLLCVTGCRAGLMEGALCVVGFSCGVKVKRLEVNCASRLAILLCTDDHAVAPRDRLSYRDWFHHAQ